jgi:hypothetical protein
VKATDAIALLKCPGAIVSLSPSLVHVSHVCRKSRLTSFPEDRHGRSRKIRIRYSGALHLYRVFPGRKYDRSPGALGQIFSVRERISECFFCRSLPDKVQRTDDICSFNTIDKEAKVQRTGIFLCLNKF